MESTGEGEYSWLLDWLVEYVKTPDWQEDINEFLDDNCILFAGDVEDENSLEFTSLHKEFKELIDEKLDEFCEEYGIKHEHFIMAAQQMQNKYHSHAVDQLVACENFLLFKRFMIHRNKVLNQKALSEIEKGGNQVPVSYTHLRAHET